MKRSPNLCVDAPPFLLLHSIIKGEEHCPLVLSISPPDLGSSLLMRVTAH
jgi:hypothetical protein